MVAGYTYGTGQQRTIDLCLVNSAETDNFAVWYVYVCAIDHWK